VKRFDRRAISDPAGLTFGLTPTPLITRDGLSIGGGCVYPELNFTLPPMFINAETMPEISSQYRQIITEALTRAVELETSGLVVEFETLQPVTENPAWASKLTGILLDAMAEARGNHGLRTVLRITPNDTREMERPPRIRNSWLHEGMVEMFDGCAAGCRVALELIRDAHRKGTLKIQPRELPWLGQLEKAFDSFPANETEFIETMIPRVDQTRVVLADYDVG